MNTSLNWIKEYVPELNCTDKEFADALTLSGTKVETFRRLDKNLEKIVTGRIEEIEKHPDADKLVVCKVDVGGDSPLQIVTGASNVTAGDIVPVVMDGGKVAGGHDGGALPEEGISIKSGKLRGVNSYGMLCSIEELGMSREFYPEAPENGIYIFPEGTPVGADAPEILGLRDTVFEFEITSNRVDCYSEIGIAREAAATFKLPFVPPKTAAETCGECGEALSEVRGKTIDESANGSANGSVNEVTGKFLSGSDSDKSGEVAADYISVEIADPDLCSRFTARIVKNIHFAPSPKWMQVRLMSAGIRPINNLVDITNYVMLEYGQPMHAYDYDLIRGHKIIVKRAGDREIFETLDQQKRTLDHTVLTIRDAEGAIGVAGIMGGQNSKITDKVKTMVFEAACFDGTNVRQSARKIGDRTEASGYFEKGLDPNLAEQAINRACELVSELNAGEVVEGIVDVYPVKREPVTLKCTSEEINALLGTNLTASEMAEILRRLSLSVSLEGETLTLKVPTFRQDIHRMCDVAEEVARFYGYDKIPSAIPFGSGIGSLSPKLFVNEKIRHLSEALGYSQAYLYSFESPKVYDKLLYPDNAAERRQVRIANPLGEDFSVMRTVSVNGMLTSLSTNFNRRNKDVSLYELANVYIPKELPLESLPDERPTLTLGSIGQDVDFFKLKGDAETILFKLGLYGLFKWDNSCKEPFLHPGRRADIIYEGKKLGYLGEVHPEVLDNYGIGERAYLCVLDLPEVYPFVNSDVKYVPLGKFPAVSRDFSMLVPDEISAGQIEDILRQRSGKLLEEIKLFDIYTGAQVKEGFKSMAYTVTLRSSDHTLTEDEINRTVKKILNGLEGINIQLRT